MTRHLIDDGTVFRMSETEYRLCTAERSSIGSCRAPSGFDGVIIEGSQTRSPRLPCRPNLMRGAQVGGTDWVEPAQAVRDR